MYKIAIFFRERTCGLSIGSAKRIILCNKKNFELSVLLQKKTWKKLGLYIIPLILLLTSVFEEIFL